MDLDHVKADPPRGACSPAASGQVPEEHHGQRMISTPSLQEFLDRLRVRGIRLSLAGEQLRCNAPKGALTPELRDELARWKPDLIRLLQESPSTTDSRSDLLTAPRNGPLPLSFAQQRLWFLHQLDPDSPAYNLPLLFRLSGPLDRTAIAAALTEIVRRHEALRTTFSVEDGQPAQKIAEPGPVGFEEQDFQLHTPQEAEAAMMRLVTHELKRPIRLSSTPLLHATLIRIRDGHECLLLILHHIASDGWSLAVFRREFTALYDAFRNGRESPFEELAFQYADFAFSQRRWLEGPESQRQLAYWTHQLAGCPSSLQLPTDRERPPSATYNGAMRVSTLPGELCQKLKSLGQTERASFFMTLLAAFNVLLHRYTGEEDILIGIPDGNRHAIELEPMQGLFVNTLVIRTRLSGRPGFRDLVRRVRQGVLEAHENRDLPFEKLVEALQPRRSLSHAPIFQVMFVMQNTPLEEFVRSAPALERSVTVPGIARYDLTIYAIETGGGLNLSLEFNTDLFDESTIERMEGHWRQLLQSASEDFDGDITTLAILPPKERQQLLEEWNATSRDYPRDTCLHQLFEAQVGRTPSAPAAVCGARQLTYRELNRAANRVARKLCALGVGRGARVAVLLPRSPELLVALLGVLKTGAAYVPLDPAYPRQRLDYMLSDADVAAVVTTDAETRSEAPGGVPVLAVDGLERLIVGEADDANHDSLVTPNDPAYVIYTSGSTGRPKGALVPHRGVVNYLNWCVEAYQVGEGGGAPVHSSVAFDLTVTALFAPLVKGEPVLLLPEGASLEEFASALVASGPFSLVKVTPAHLELLARLIPSPAASAIARFLVIGGENLSAEALAFWREHAPDTALINEYGPTETTVGCCAFRVPHGTLEPGVVPIGRPIANTRLYVLDPRQQPVPIGVAGELYIGGDCVGLGYWNRPELTAERFIQSPFDPRPEAKLYRTGDRVRYLADGNLVCLGRLDHQVKIRGYRIELGEIESLLKEQPGVNDALVVVREDTPGDRRLVAYLVADTGRAPSPEALQDSVGRMLPEYMCPTAWVVLASLPLTANGKVDRGSLPVPGASSTSQRFDAVPPRTEAEQRLLQLWREVLRLDHVGIQDNFFDIGGHSMLLVRLHARIEETFGIRFPLVEMFRHPTVSRLAERVIGQDGSPPDFADVQERARRQRSHLSRQKDPPPSGAES